MPPGAKKRKALKKKQQQQQPTVTSTNTKGYNRDNLHGHHEHGGQDVRETDGSSLNSPVSQENELFGDPSGFVNNTVKEISDVPQGLGPKNGYAISVDKKKTVEKLPIHSSENCTQTAKNVACHDASVKENASVSKERIPEKSVHVETSTFSNLFKNKSDETKEYPPSMGLEKDNGEVATLPGSAAGTSRKVENVKESEVPVSSEEKRLLLPGTPTVRTSWLSCCGLFEAMSGSDR